MPDTNCTPEEIWKTIEEFPDYAVSNLGRVKRIAPGHPMGHSYVGKILSQGLRKGYPYVELRRKDGELSRIRKVSVHKALATAFIGPCPTGMEVNHKNGVKHDCRADNLEYLTKSGNHKHAYAIGIQKPTILTGERNGRMRVTEEQVRQIRESTESCVVLAERFSTGRRNILMIRKRKARKCVP